MSTRFSLTFLIVSFFYVSNTCNNINIIYFILQCTCNSLKEAIPIFLLIATKKLLNTVKVYPIRDVQSMYCFEFI